MCNLLIMQIFVTTFFFMGNFSVRKFFNISIGEIINTGTRKEKGMSLFTKIMGFAAKNYTKVTGKALSYISKGGELPVKTYLKTGTKVIRDPEVGKIIKPGKGNFLRSKLGITEVTSYPKGSILGGNSGLVSMSFKNGFDYACTPKAFGEYVRDMLEMASSKIVG